MSVENEKVQGEVQNEEQNSQNNMSIEEMIASGDPELNQKAIDAMTNPQPEEPQGDDNSEPQNKPEQPNESQPDPEQGYENKPEDSNSEDQGISQEQIDQANRATEQYNKMRIKYHGSDIEYDDSDGYLGRKDLDGLKKANAHARAYIEDLERQVAESNQNLMSMQSQQPQESKDTFLDSQGQNNYSQQENQQTGQNEQPSSNSESPNVDFPEAPEMPDLPADQLDWTAEQSKQFQDYLKKNNEYQRKMAEYLKSGRGMGRTDDIEELKNTIKKQQEVIDKVQKDYSEKERSTEEEKYWSTIENFRNSHKEYKGAPKDIKSLHHEVNKWLDRLANSTGNPFPRNETEKSRFENTKLVLAQKYLDGDPSVTELGVQPPQGYDEYFKLAELMNKKQDFVNQGLLGKNASLHDVWLLEQDRSGTFQNGFEQAENNAMVEGKNSAVRAMADRNQRYANNIPNNANSVPETPSDSNSEFTQMSNEEVNQLLSMTPEQMQVADPTVLQKREKLLNSIQT